MVYSQNTTSNEAMSGLIKINLSLMYFVPNHTQNKTGNVPNANAHIINAHCNGLLDCKAYSCMLWVKPQGRRKVNAHTIPAYLGFLRLKIVWLSQLGRWNHRLVIFGTIPSNCKPRYNKTAPTSTLKIALNRTDPQNCDQTNPSRAHHTTNDIILPIWNLICVQNALVVCTDSLYQIIMPPVTARQVDIDATNPIINATPNERSV